MFRASTLLKGQSFSNLVSEVKGDRGMDYHHDDHDRLGGYPDESITPREFGDLVESPGFRIESTGELFDNVLMAMSTGCHEILFRNAA